MSEPLCRDCRDLQREVKATRLIGKTPVCDEHMRQRLGTPAFSAAARPAVATGRAAMEMAKEAKNMPKRTNEETRAAILRDYEAGMNVNAIAVKHGVGWMTAKTIIKASGKTGNGGGEPGRGAGTKPANGAVTLTVTPELVDAIWATLPLEKKAALLNRLNEAG